MSRCDRCGREIARFELDDEEEANRVLEILNAAPRGVGDDDPTYVRLEGKP